jgi:PDZ domain-containing protein
LLQCRAHGFAVEGRKGDDGTSTHGWPVTERIEQGRQSCGVAEAADRCDGGFACTSVRVRASSACELADRRTWRFAERPTSGFYHQDVRIAKSRAQRCVQWSRRRQRRGEIATTPTNGGIGIVAQDLCERAWLQASAPSERPEGDLTQTWILGPEPPQGGRPVPAMPGDHHVDRSERPLRDRIVLHQPSMSESDPTSTKPPRRSPTWRYAAVLVVVLLVAAGIVADHIDLSYYVLTPGVAQPVAPLVSVPRARAHRLDGSVLLTDVYLTRVTALSYLYDKLRGDAQILPAAQVLGPATPPSQLVEQGYLEMEQSQLAAKAAAFQRLGYRVSARPSGVVIFAVVSPSPAQRVLSVGQLVTAVDGHRTLNACAFARALGAHRPGSEVSLAVERTHVSSRARLVAGPRVREQVRLGRWPSSVPHPSATPACPGTGWHGQGFLGVEAQTQLAFRFPFPVSLRTTSIGGPSAGLAMTLGLIDTLWNGKLTAGKRVAATGTIEPTGGVGPVGGVPEKTVAVERAGATVFFVPATQVSTATSKATPSLHVYGVRSLGQALVDLRRLGGSVPPPAPKGS